VIDGNSFEHNSNPYSVDTGDFNGDNFLDIVVVNSDTNNIGIFVNYGNGTFASQMTFTTGDYSRPLSIASADFNNDTHLDVAVTNYDTHNIGLFLGYGNGTFANQTTFSTGVSRPVSLAVGDFNNDHCLDIVVTNNGTNNIAIIFGYGNGSFGNQITYSTGYDSLPCFVVVDDFNNDHHLDIAVTNYGTDNIGVFRGYGNGSFTTQIIYSTNPRSKPCWISVNDLNKDGHLDIVVANSGTNTVGIFFGYGNENFALQKIYSLPPGSNLQSIIIADFNQDNLFDVAVSNSDNNSINVFIGYGNGSFATPTIHSTGIDSNPLGMTAGDFDNNNQSDIAVVNFDTNNVLVLIGYSMIPSETPTAYSTGSGSLPFQILSGDFNNDTQLDLVALNSGTSNVGVFLAYGNGSFQEQITYSSGTNSRPYGFAVSDLDNDYRLDIITANSNTESIGILYGYGNGSFDTVVTYSTGTLSSPIWVTVDDFNNDNHLDIAYADYGTDSIGVFLGYGNRIFGSLTKYSCRAGSRPYSIATADFNNDGQLDFTVANFGTDNIIIFLGSYNGTFKLFIIYSTGVGSLPYMLTIADLNNDDQLDIIVDNSGTSTIGIFLGFGNGSFSTQLTYSTGSNAIPYWVSVADFNNDYLLDIAAANSNLGDVIILLGNGQGHFGSQTNCSTGINSQPYAIAADDFNKDNRLDIAVANYGSSNVAILLGHHSKDSINQTHNINDTDSQSNSTIANRIPDDVPILLGDYYADFRSQIAYSTGSSSRPYSIAIGHLNNDTKMDIIVANSGNENIGILFGYGNGSFTTEMTYSIGTGSNPQNVVVDDFNKDNQLDVALTNPREDSIIVLIGNGNGTFSTDLTYSTGSGSNPSSLVIGNLNNDEYLDLVVANEGTDTIGIFFGFDYILFTKQKPCETGDIETPYSLTVGDFNNDGYLDIATGLYSTNNIGIFLGYGNGTFKPMMKYAHTPSSHTWGITVGDFNNDRQLDITVANWGINGIGVILGYGNGSFAEPILYSTGSGSRSVSVTVADLNNDNCLDIIAGNYGGHSIAVFLGYGNGSFRDAIILSTGQSSRSFAVTTADINNDSQLDIIVANSGLSNIGVFLGYGNGSFQEQITSSSGDYSAPWGVDVGDFNKDGRLDLATANYGTSNIAVLFGYGNGTFGNLQAYPTDTDSNPTCVKVADFNNDKQLDIIVTDRTSKNVGVFFGYNDGTFASISTIFIGENSLSYSIGVGYFNNDNYLDFVLADSGSQNIGVYLSSDSIPFGGQTTFNVNEGSRPSSVAVGHFNNDNQLDIAITNYGTSNMGILLGYGNRTFSDVITYSTGNNSYPMSLAIGDFNNDSINDIVVANSESDNIVVFIGYGNGSFFMLRTYSMDERSQPVSIAVGHFNRDYQLDIVVANFGSNNVCVLFGSGNGTFTNQKLYPMEYDSQPNWVIFKDINNDGWEDTAVVTSGIDNIKILLNLC
jgi:hypothetical protein